MFSLIPSVDELNDIEISEPEIKIPSTDKINSEVEINAVASYTLSAMCEEEAIRTEEEIEEALKLKKLVKSAESQNVKISKKTAKKMTEAERQQKWLENAKISESDEYYIGVVYNHKLKKNKNKESG